MRDPDVATRRRFSIALWIWAAAIVAVSTGELLPGGTVVLRWAAATGVGDKTQHFSAYLLLAIIPVLGFDQPRGLVAALSMILMGVALEFTQTLIPGRTFELLDMAANSLGVLAGIGIGYALVSWRPPEVKIQRKG